MVPGLGAIFSNFYLLDRNYMKPLVREVVKEALGLNDARAVKADKMDGYIVGLHGGALYLNHDFIVITEHGKTEELKAAIGAQAEAVKGMGKGGYRDWESMEEHWEKDEFLKQHVEALVAACGESILPRPRRRTPRTAVEAAMQAAQPMAPPPLVVPQPGAYGMQPVNPVQYPVNPPPEPNAVWRVNAANLGGVWMDANGNVI